MSQAPALVRYAVEITVDPEDGPTGWVGVTIGPDRYSYRRGSLRGMFQATDEKGINDFIAKAVPTMLTIERMNAEQEAAEQERQKQAELAAVEDQS
jgi:hypothetical protein